MAAAELCRWDDTKWPELCWKLRTSKAAVDVRTELLRKTWPRAPPEWLELEEAQDLLRPHVEPKDLASLLDASTATPLGVGASKLRTRSLLALIEPCEMHCLEVKLLGLWGLQGLGFCKLQLRLAGHRVFEKSCFLGPCQGQLACLLDSADAFQLAIPMSCGDTLAELFSDQPGLEIHLFNEFGEGRALVGELSGMEMACLGDGEWQMESSVFLESTDHAGVQILSSSVVLDGPSLRLVVSHSHAPAALDAVPFWLETSASSAPTAEVAVPSSEEPQDLILTLRQLELLQSAREEALRRGADLGLIDQTGGARFKVYCISMAGETLCAAEAGWGGILDATVRAYEMLLELRLVLCNGDEVSLCHRSFRCRDLDALLEGAPLGASLALGTWAKLSLEMSRPMRAVGPVGSVESETALMGSPISGGEAADAEAQSEGVASLKSEERCAEAELGAQAGPHDLNAIDSESSCHSMASPHTARLTGASEGLGQPSVMLEITNALHLPLVLQKCPNTFVSYTWLPESEDLGDTEVIYHSTCPYWDHRATLHLPRMAMAHSGHVSDSGNVRCLVYPAALEDLVLQLKLWHQPARRSSDRRMSEMSFLLGSCQISLAPLVKGFHELDGYFHVSSADGSTCGQLRVKLRASLASFCLSPDRSRDEPASRAREVEMPSLPGWPVVSTDESLALEQGPTVEEHLHEEEDEELSLLREGGELPSNQLLARMREELALEPVAVTDLALESDESCELGRSTEVLEPKALSFDHVKIEGFSSISEVVRQKITELDDLQQRLLMFDVEPAVKKDAPHAPEAPHATEAAHEPPRPTRRHELPDEPEPAAEESLGSEPPTWREAPPKEAPTPPRPVVTSLRGAGAPPPRSETSRDGTSSASRAAVEGAVRVVEVRQEKSSPGPLDGRGPLPQELVHERSRMEVRPLPEPHPARAEHHLLRITSAGPVTRRQSPSAETQSPEPAEVPMAFARRSPTLFAASTSTPSPPRRRGEQQSPALAPRSAESTVQRAESTWTLQNAALEKTSPWSQASERPRWATSPLSWSIERTRLASTGSTHVPTPERPARPGRSERLTGWSERLDVKTQRLARILRGAPKSESESE